MTQTVTTEWPWLWHPNIHWYHPHLNLSSVEPKIWDALHLGVLTSLPKVNESHKLVKWVVYRPINYVVWNELYYKEYEGTSRNMFVCWPMLLGKYPEWYTCQRKYRCTTNHTPAQAAYLFRQKEWSFVYKREKPFVDITIGIGTCVTIIGVSGNYYHNFC